MWELLSQRHVQVALNVLALTTVLVVAYAVIAAIRRSTSTSATDNHDLADDFEEMRLEGDINEEELRTIRAVLEKSQPKR